MFSRSRIHAIFILIAIGVVFVGGLLLLRSRLNDSVGQARQERAVGALRAGSLEIPISIADTEASRNQGLSGTPSLPANAGKLFIFDTPDSYGFWMKDMEYSLDFVWINQDKKIIAITPNVAAATFPQIFYPPAPVMYVLEVNAGFSQKNNLIVGEQLSW